MAQRGRKSGASLSVLTNASPIGQKRIKPPASMTEAEKSIWALVVNDQSADSFTDTHAALLELYCGHVVRARIIAEQIIKVKVEWLAGEEGLKIYDEGLKRYDKLSSMADRESRAASSLATRLRITRQAVDQQTIALAQANNSKRKKPWDKE
jgi:hypothetical protein